MQPPVNPYAPPAPRGMGARPPGDLVSDTVVDHLRNTKPWVGFLGVLGFVGSGLLLLGGCATIAVSSQAGSEIFGGMGVAVGVAYFILAPIYIFPSLFLWRYNKAIGDLLVGGGMPAMEEAMGHQKSFWRFAGISTAVFIGLYLVIVFGAMVAGFSRAF